MRFANMSNSLNATDHVNPCTITSQNRHINLFEKVGNKVTNLNSNVLPNFQQNARGFQGYSQISRNGKQVWVHTLDGKIINAEINVIQGDLSLGTY